VKEEERERVVFLGVWKGVMQRRKAYFGLIYGEMRRGMTEVRG